jgi:hypothetical protein
VDGRGIPLGAVTAGANRHDSPLLLPNLEHASASVGQLPEGASVHLGTAATTHYSPASASKSEGSTPRDSQERPAGTSTSRATLGGGEDQFLAQRS